VIAFKRRRDSLMPQGEAMARKAFKTMLQLGDELPVSGRCGATLLWHDVSKPYLM